MISSLILRITAVSTVACARRINMIPGSGVVPINGPGTDVGPLITPHSIRPMKVGIRKALGQAHLQPQDPASADDGVRRLYRRNSKGWITIPGYSLASDGTPEVPPPVKVDGMDTRSLLLDWADSFLDMRQDTAELQSEQISRLAQNKVERVMKMARVIAEAGTSLQSFVPVEKNQARLLEAVGLISQPSQGPFSVVDAPILALGVFQREQVKDDAEGSLRKKVEEKFGQMHTKRFRRRGFGRRKSKFDVFAVEGLAEAPGLPELSARVLLSKIAQYAETEQKLVVVPERACISSTGADLTDYYVRLGFEKVPTLVGHGLIYTADFSSTMDKWLEDGQVMIRENLWPESGQAT